MSISVAGEDGREEVVNTEGRKDLGIGIANIICR